MKTFIFLLCTTVFSFTPKSVLSQNAKIVIDSNKSLTVDEVFKLIKTQTDYRFIYQEDMFKGFPKVELKKGVIVANELLEKSLNQQDFNFQFNGNNTIIIKKTAKDSEVQQTIKGKITDENGVGLFGANVAVKGTKNVAVSDFDGNYEIQVSGGSTTLVFSFVGFKNQEILVGNQKTINVALQPNVAALEDVVVIGYGKAKKEDLTGAVSVIKGEDLRKTTQPSVESILGGRVSGVNVTRNGGAPGAGASIQIRGYSSLRGSNEPLYVVDGVPFQPSLGDSNANINPLSFINPADIESVVVLKDASSTAIYGSRAANGVVMITTKLGNAKQKPTLEVDFNSSFQIPSFRAHLLNKDQFLDVMEQAYTNAKQPFNRSTFDLGGNTNWVDESLSVGVMNNLNIGATGASDSGKTRYASSLGLTDQDGILQPSNYKRYDGRVNVETQVNDRFKIGTMLNYIYSKRNPGPQFRRIVFQRPDMPINYDTFNANYPNGLLQARNAKNLAGTDVIFGSAFAELELFKGLTAKSAFNINKLHTKSFTFNPGKYDQSGVSKRVDTDYEKTTYVWDNTLTYNRVFSEKHHLNAVAGASWNQDVLKLQNIQSQGFANDEFLYDLGSASSIASFNTSESVSGLASFFTRMSYNFSNKYYLTLTGRADKSSKFGPNNKWGYFPSAGAAWDISKEDFMKNDVVNTLKLKSSVGVTGLASFPDFLYRTLYSMGSFYNNQNGFAPTAIPNEDIKWEKTTQFDAGVDFGLFNNRVSGSLGYFSKYTKDLILDVPIPLEPGGGVKQVQNIGELSNTGVEFELNTSIINTHDLKWDMGFNITFQKNIVEKIKTGTVDDFAYTYLEEGKPLGSFLGYVSEGLFRSQQEIDDLNAKSPTGVYMFGGTTPTSVGDRKIKDLDGDGRITTADRTIIGNSLPDYYGGLNSNLRYKRFELAVNFQFSGGAELIPDIYRIKSTAGTATSIENLTTDALKAWTPTNTNTNVPRNILTSSTYNHSYSVSESVEDASYLKLKNIRLGYDLSKNDLIKGMNAVIYISASDLLTFTKYRGEDPEIYSSSPVSQGNVQFGVDPVSYPYSRTVSLGLNFKF